jgi:hypothetical protein
MCRRCIAGQVADDLKEEGRTVITPYVSTQNGHKQQGMTVLIGADHGKGAGRRYLKIFSHDGKNQRVFQGQAKHERKRIMGDCGYCMSQTASIMQKRPPDYSDEHGDEASG